ncbi:MAG: TonB-dependent receptor, partial [Pseudomonadota bacterium]
MKKGFSRNALRFVGATSALIPVGMPTTVLAQTVDGAAVRRADEIIVTARRREESLQDIPVSVSALTGDRIAELQADDLSGIQYSVPNFYFDEGDASNAVVYLRGIGQNDSLAFADAGVGVYVDDVFIARSQAAFLELFDVERVEVLRGPQGTLYGRNTIGGAVKFISKEPTDEVEAYAEFGAGNFGMITAKGRLSGPVSDRIRMKAAVAYTKRDGFNENQFDGLDNGDQDSLSGRIGIYFDARDDLDFALTVDARRERPDTARSPALVTPARGFPDPVGQPFFVQTFQPNADPFVVNTNASNRSDTDALGITLRGTWQMNDQWSFESITSYRTFDFDLQLDTDGTPLPLLDVAVIQEQSQFSQELRASYEGDNGLSATGGLYYFHDDDLTFSGVDNLGAVLSFPAVPGGPILDFSVPLLGLASSALADTDQITDSYAVFADVTWDFAPRWSVSAGLRYTLEEKSSARRFEQFFDPTLFVVPNPPEFLVGNGVPGVVIENEDDFDAFTPRFSLSYAPTDDILLYASASRGFKSGG